MTPVSFKLIKCFGLAKIKKDKIIRYLEFLANNKLKNNIIIIIIINNIFLIKYILN